ncbi:MAG: insulinase family protein [Candidatus Marinimicrobia bacterium]|nr:insulinase family protein [Candidatus Neomarinimicrobiota bacterium]MCF7903782.1 insulinase family protein [Candidatus Neomarinimicrobiota bacterium]
MTMRKGLLLASIIISTISGLLAAGQAGVSIHKLNNGMDVLLVENKALPMVGVNVVVKTGSAYETYETSGMSHMLEHLLFNGTTTRTQRELYDDTDLIGGYNNANTGDYYTNYMMVMPAENQIKGMELQADMLFNSILPGDKFEKEKGIVLEEIAQSLSKPATQMEYNLAAELYKGHALSLPTLGTYATIQHMSRDDVNDYYKSTYLPNNMVLSAIGNFDSETMLDEIKRIYGAAAPGSVYRPSDSILKTGMDRSTAVTLRPGSWLDRYYGGEMNTLHQIFALPAGLSPEIITLMQMGLNDKTSELKEKLESQFPGQVDALEVEMHNTPIADHLALKLTLPAGSNPESISKALFKLMRKVRIKTPKATLASLATQEKTDFLRNSEKPHMFGIYNSQAFAVKGIDGVLDLPTEESLGEAAAKLKKFRFKKEPAVIFHHAGVLKTDDVQGGVRTELLGDHDQGMGLIVRQNPASELLAIHYLFKYKAAFEAEHGKSAAKILHDCFGQRMKTPEKEALSQQYGLKFTVNDNPWIPMDNIYLHPDFGYIRVEGLANDLKGAIAFLNSEMNGFIPTEDEFIKAQAKFSRGMMHGAKDKANELFVSLKDSVLYGPEQETKQKTLDYAGLVSFAAQYFAPGNRIVSVVSPGDPSSVETYFLAGAAATSPTEKPMTERNLLKRDAPVDLDLVGGGERSYLFWGFVKDVEKGDEAAIKALSLLLSDRIIFDVREQQGMAYRMSATADVKGDKALFYITLGTRPQNADVLIPQFPTLMSKETVADITENDVTRAINMYLGRMTFRRLSSINQAYYLGTSEFFHGDMLYDETQLKALRDVRLEDVKRIAGKYLQAENEISIVVR